MYFDIEKYELEMLEDTRFSKLKLYLAHSGLNNNKSTISLSVLQSKDVENSVINAPILAHIIKEDDDFGEHEMEYDEDSEKINYIEKPIGVIPAINHSYHYEEIDGRTYAVVYGYIWNVYAQDAVEIIQREQNIKLSVEIVIDESKFNNTTKILDIKKFRYTGVTLLGKKFETGMIGAHAVLEKFSKTNKDKFSKNLDELNNYLLTFSNNEIDINMQNVFSKTSKYETEEDYVVPKSKEEIAIHFKLTSNQLNSEISKVLREHKYITRNWCGESVERECYYLTDYDESYVYYVDAEDSYLNKKAPYKLIGDNVEVMFKESKRIKYSPVDWVEGEDEEISVMSEFSATLESESAEKFKLMKEENETSKSTYSSKLSEKDDLILEMAKTIKEIEAKFSQADKNIQEKNDEIKKMSEVISKYKQDEDDEKVEILFAEYVSLITEDEKKNLKEKRSQFSTFEGYEKEIKSFVCDRIVKKAKDHKMNFISMGILHDHQDDENKDEKKEQSHWDRLEKKVKNN
ncbi:hypothetical protein NV379_02600 [Paenibacillus sp. N1-5-1-14]|nr:hypothetical protein [Paenibacillus radicibacter]